MDLISVSVKRSDGPVKKTDGSCGSFFAPMMERIFKNILKMGKSLDNQDTGRLPLKIFAHS